MALLLSNTVNLRSSAAATVRADIRFLGEGLTKADTPTRTLTQVLD